MGRPRLLIALGVGAFLLLLIVTMPAQLVLGRLERFGIRASGVSGSLWNGQAVSLRAGTTDLGRLTWDLHLLKLLTGRASASVTLKQNDGFAQGDVAASLSGRILFSDFTASWPLAALSGAGVPAGWKGTANAKLDELALQNGIPTAITGTIDMVDLVGPANRPASLGSYRATFPAPAAASETGGVAGTLQDVSGPIEVMGTLRISPDRSYVIDGQIATRPDAPANIVDAIRYLGEPDGQGRRPFSLAGTF